MSSLNTDWNCQFSIQALSALYKSYIGYTHQGIQQNQMVKCIVGLSMLLINLVHKLFIIWQLI